MIRLIKILLLLTPIFFVSCLDVVEEIDLKSNGSGVATYTFNLSQSKIKLNTLLKLDSVAGHKVPKLYEVEREIMKATSELKSREGIINASYTIDDSEYIYTLKVVFKDLNALNKAITEMSYWKKSKWKPQKDFYKVENNILTKNVEAIIIPDNRKGEIEKRKENLSLGNFTFILRSVNELQINWPTELKLSGNKKAVMFRENLYMLSKREKELTLKAKII